MNIRPMGAMARQHQRMQPKHPQVQGNKERLGTPPPKDLAELAAFFGGEGTSAVSGIVPDSARVTPPVIPDITLKSVQVTPYVDPVKAARTAEIKRIAAEIEARHNPAI